MKTHYSLIRTIYLYLFTIVGLTLLVIGTVRFVDMRLKAFVFTQAEEQERLWQKQPPMPSRIEKIEVIGEVAEGEKVEITEGERAQIKQWLVIYNNWKERNETFDQITVNRHRNASINLALIVVGLPLYLYHWSIIKRETKKKV